MAAETHNTEILAGPWQQIDLDTPIASPAYADAVNALRSFLDSFAAAKPDDDMAAEMSAALATLRDRLETMRVGEQERVFGRAFELPGRGQTMTPPFVLGSMDDMALRGTVRFGDYFLGGNGAAHGGSLSLLFDDVFGLLVSSGHRPRSRTAYLRVDFRAITPVDMELEVRAWIAQEEGRKRILRGEIRSGDILCVEAEALFVALRAGQP